MNGAQTEKTNTAIGEIRAENISKSFGERTVIDSLSFSIAYGSVTLIVGASGIGKTTLLRMLSGLEKPDTGKLYGLEDGKTVYLFQEDRLFPWLTAKENVYAVSTAKDRKERAEKILTELGLGNEADKFPGELSGGMSRRVAIARALIADGDIIILDEPFRGLDSANEENALNVIKKYCAGKTVIAVTHDTEIFSGYYDNIITLSAEKSQNTPSY